jgi:hypothetical protein
VITHPVPWQVYDAECARMSREIGRHLPRCEDGTLRCTAARLEDAKRRVLVADSGARNRHERRRFLAQQRRRR